MQARKRDAWHNRDDLFTCTSLLDKRLRCFYQMSSRWMFLGSDRSLCWYGSEPGGLLRSQSGSKEFEGCHVGLHASSITVLQFFHHPFSYLYLPYLILTDSIPRTSSPTTCISGRAATSDRQHRFYGTTAEYARLADAQPAILQLIL